MNVYHWWRNQAPFVQSHILPHLFTDTCASLEEEEALLSEMDVTGQAFEDMQEQNSRLLQQLREKDDANFKLMSERIKSNQIYKLLKEEKEELADQVLGFKTQVKCNCRVDALPWCRGTEILTCCCFLSGGRSAAGRAEARRERGRPPERAGHSGKRAGCPDASSRAQQEEGEERDAAHHTVGSYTD